MRPHTRHTTAINESLGQLVQCEQNCRITMNPRLHNSFYIIQQWLWELSVWRVNSLTFNCVSSTYYIPTLLMHFLRKYLVPQFSVLHFLVLHFPVLHFQSTHKSDQPNSRCEPALNRLRTMCLYIITALRCSGGHCPIGISVSKCVRGLTEIMRESVCRIEVPSRGLLSVVFIPGNGGGWGVLIIRQLRYARIKAYVNCRLQVGTEDYSWETYLVTPASSSDTKTTSYWLHWNDWYPFFLFDPDRIWWDFVLCYIGMFWI